MGVRDRLGDDWRRVGYGARVAGVEFVGLGVGFSCFVGFLYSFLCSVVLVFWE